ncbi:MAG: CRTAC1 family protein [Hyphomonadaceae bacterium]
MPKTFKGWFWLGCGAVGIGAILVFLLGSGWLGFRLWQLEWKPQGQTDLRFTQVDIPFENESDITKLTGSLPFMAGVVIDVDGDWADEVFLGGGRGQSDALLTWDETSGAFIDVTAEHGIIKQADDATMGGASIDVDGNGWTDLLVARESGIWLYLNEGGHLSGERLPLEINDNSTPLSIALGDINKDGQVDFYVSGYIKNSRVTGQTNFDVDYGGFSHLFINAGDLTWRDATEEYGLSSQHNRFAAVFADTDNDGDSDLIIAQDTGLVEMYENTGTPPMQPVANPSIASYPMGVAAGDFNNDGLTDFFFSNVGHTMPTPMVRGNLPGDADFNPLYMLFENEGRNVFTDTAKATKTARLGFGWGTVAADMNLDGWDDLIVAQNYAKFSNAAVVHRYTGKILQNMGGETFAPVEKRAGAVNRLFAISPLVGDFNGDHLPDLIWANLKGPAQAFINATPDRGWIEIRVPDTAAYLNARIEIELGTHTLHRQIIASQGLASDQSHKLIIGLGAAGQADSITFIQANGHTNTETNVAAGTVLDWATPAP